MAGVTSGTTSEVHSRRDERQPAERGQDDGERRRLRRQGDAEALAEPARAAARAGQRDPADPSAASPRRRARRSRASRAGTRRRRRAPARRRAAGTPPARAPPRPGRARPDSRARSTTPAMAPARSTDGEAPANTMYDDDRDGGDDRSATTPEPPGHRPPTAAATIAMFQPEIATTWLTPAVVKSAATSRSTRSRSPMRIPAASPASGSGRTRVSASPASRRQPSSSVPGSTGRSSTSIDRASSVPHAPRRSRYRPYGLSGRGRARPSTDDPIARLDRPGSAAASRRPGTRSGRRTRSGASRPGGPRAATRRSRRPSSTARRPPANPTRAAPAGPTPARSAIERTPIASARRADATGRAAATGRRGASRPASGHEHGREIDGRPVPTASAAIAARPRASRSGACSAHRHELAQLLERLLAEDAARPQLVDGGERRLLARRDDLQRRRRADPGQRLELGLRSRG